MDSAHAYIVNHLDQYVNDLPYMLIGSIASQDQTNFVIRQMLSIPSLSRSKFSFCANYVRPSVLAVLALNSLSAAILCWP